MSADAKILALLMRSGFGTGLVVPWFEDARMVSGHIVTPHEDCAVTIRRCFLSKFRDTLPDCEVIVERAPVKAAPVKSVFKGKYATPVQGDCFAAAAGERE